MADAAQAAWSQVSTYLEKLVAAIDALDDAGGLHRLASAWKPAAQERARCSLHEARRAIEGTVAQLKPQTLGQAQRPPQPQAQAQAPGRGKPRPRPPASE